MQLSRKQDSIVYTFTLDITINYMEIKQTTY